MVDKTDVVKGRGVFGLHDYRPGVKFFESVLIKKKFRDGYRGVYWVVSHHPYFLVHSTKDLGLNFSAIFFHFIQLNLP